MSDNRETLLCQEYKNKNKSNKVWFVYIIECSDNTLYTGITNDLDNRIKTHNSGKGAKYAMGRRPVKLLTTWSFNSKSQALKEEYRIKKLSKENKLKLIYVN